MAATGVGGDIEERPHSVPVQVRDVPTIRYYDIMILGMTGQGKTTTAEKLLIANPEKIDYESEYPKPTDKVPREDPSRQKVFIQDLSMWLIPKDPYALEQISTRLKNLAFYRVLDDPHKLVNKFHESEMHVSTKTDSCELFSNDSTKVRVLDVPGFFGAIKGANQYSHNITLSAKETHLGTMRNILQIQAAMVMKLKRILYFLPCRDALQIANATLQEELQLMCYYFGKSIFEAMVLVATLGPITYGVVPEAFPVEVPGNELERSRNTFQEALKSFLPVDTPKPPIIFISLRESCESILQKVQEAEVANSDGLQLQLNSTVCSRCSMTFGERSGMKVACTSGEKWSEPILYEDSHCHPFFVPKYTRRQVIAKRLSYVLGGGAELPDFSEEICHKCEGQPGSRGCLKVQTKYEMDGKLYTVDHTSKVENHRLLFQGEDEADPGAPSLPPHSPNDSEKEDSSDCADDGRKGFLSDASIHARIKRRVKADVEHDPRARRDRYSTGGRDSDESEEGVHEEKVQVDIEPVNDDSVPEIERLPDEPEKIEKA